SSALPRGTKEPPRDQLREVASSDPELRKRCGPSSHAELLVDVLEVFSDRAWLDYQDLRDLGVREAIGHAAHHLLLARGQLDHGPQFELPGCLRQATPDGCGAIGRCQMRT